MVGVKIKKYIKCIFCGKKFFRSYKKNSKNFYIFDYDWEKRKYCSEKCKKEKWNKYRRDSKKYKNGRKKLYKLNQKKILNKTRKYRIKYRKRILDYYDNKCAICGFDKVLDIHHLNEDKKHKADFMGDLCRFIVLCPNHHLMFHRGILSKGEIIKYVKK